jgi:hypothetical protein
MLIPFRVSVKPGAPATIAAGLIDVSVGAGLTIGSVSVFEL